MLFRSEEQLTSILNKGIPFVEALPRSASAMEIKKMIKDLNESSLKKIPEHEKEKVSGLQKLLGFGR